MPSIFLKSKFLSKNGNFSYLWLKYLIWVFLGDGFKKLMSYFKSSLWNLWNFNQKFQLSSRKEKLKLSSENVFLSKFRREFEKTILTFEVSSFEFNKCKCLYYAENLEFGTKNTIFGYFLDRIWWKLLSYLISAHSNLSKYKVSCYRKKNWDENCLIWLLWTVIWKNYCHIWNQLHRFCQYAKFHVKKIYIFDTKNAMFGYF